LENDNNISGQNPLTTILKPKRRGTCKPERVHNPCNAHATSPYLRPMSPAKMPAGGEPPLRTSSWSWSPWKSRSRRNSESSGSPPAAATNTTKPVKTGGRNSLSSIDHRNAESVRNDVAEVMAAAAKKNGGILTAEEIGGGVTYGGGAGATRPTRRSASQ